jgi:hypothetical protein
MGRAGESGGEVLAGSDEQRAGTAWIGVEITDWAGLPEAEPGELLDAKSRGDDDHRGALLGVFQEIGDPRPVEGRGMAGSSGVGTDDKAPEHVKGRFVSLKISADIGCFGHVVELQGDMDGGCRGEFPALSNAEVDGPLILRIGEPPLGIFWGKIAPRLPRRKSEFEELVECFLCGQNFYDQR